MKKIVIPHIVVALLFVSFLGTGLIVKADDVAPTNQEPHPKMDSDPVAVQPPKDKFPENLVMTSVAETSPKNIFIADKSKRTLTVWTQKNDMPELVGAFPMDIGKSKGDKSASGDFKTPEGIYFLQTRLEGKSLDYRLYGKRAFTLDYPNLFDQFAGKTGSGIWLHSVPDTTSLLRGSRGCVVVRNEIIERLTPYIRLKSTPLLILDSVKYVSADELIVKRKQLQAWINSWREAWANKQIDAYMNYYDDNFKAMRMRKSTWRRYKEGLAKKYSYIKVNLLNPLLITRNDEAIISFLQNYESDGLKDIGEKILYLKMSPKNLNAETQHTETDINHKDDDKMSNNLVSTAHADSNTPNIELPNYKILTEIWRPLENNTVGNAAAN